MSTSVNYDQASHNGIAPPGIWPETPAAAPDKMLSRASNTVPPRVVSLKGNQNLNIALIDDRLLLRDAFAKCLETAHEGFSIMCFSSVAEWQNSAKIGPDIALVLLCRSTRKIAESRDEIKAISAEKIPIILVSDEEDVNAMRDIIALGARGFIPERVELQLAVAAIYLVHTGGVYLPETILQSPPAAASDENNTGGSQLQKLFTERQAAVVEALRKGKPNKVIAYELNMRESTVKVHIRNVMAKLKAKNRTEVAFIANTLCRDERN
jgi:DNA-binding NarL/FixJ family response regulator